MPTYKNVSNKTITVDLGLIVKDVEPGETISTYYILDDIDGLERISDEPFYNPIEDVIDLSFLSSDDTKTVDIKNPKMTSQIKILNITTEINVYFNSELNEPPLPLLPGDVITISNPNVIDKLIIKPKTAGNCRIIVLSRKI